MAEGRTSGLTMATLWDDADIETWWAPDADVTGRLLAAIAVASQAVPALNARFDPVRGVAEPLASIDVGIVIDTKSGLIVPVLCDVGHLTVTEIRRVLTSLRTLAAQGPCAPTITLANFGHVAGRYAALPIVAPQVALVAAGRVGLQAHGHGRQIAFHHMLPLSLNYDNRAVSVGEAAQFLATMIADLARPELPLSRGRHAPP